MTRKPNTKTSKTAPVRAGTNTKRKLIDAAHTLIWANSYTQVSVDDICREAGVRKGSFYHFFPSKSDLAAAALEDCWHECKDELDAFFAVKRDAKEQHPHDLVGGGDGKQQVAEDPGRHADEDHPFHAELPEEERDQQHEDDLGHLADGHR